MGQTYKLFTSYLWQTTSTVVSTDERIYLFDPAYFPQEIDGILIMCKASGMGAS